MLSLDFEGTIGGFISEGIRTVLVVSVDLFQDRDRGGRGLLVMVLGQSDRGQAENDDLRTKTTVSKEISLSSTLYAHSECNPRTVVDL